MDTASEVRVLLARLHALEVQFIALDDRLVRIEKKLDEHEQALHPADKG